MTSSSDFSGVDAVSGSAARPFESHDHSKCISTILSEAEKLCAERRAQFTPVRRRVLEFLLESHRPVGAYALLDRLRAEYEERGKTALFDVLREHLIGGPTVPYVELAERLGHTEGALKVAVHRMRQRYRGALRREVADTVDDPSEVEDELRRLLLALA